MLVNLDSDQLWINDDVIINMCKYMDDKTKIYLLSVNRQVNLIKNKILYDGNVCITKIQNL